ncbi:MAG: ABC transporter substrate-binding protein, partial [Candidatus Woesebacteria bacterium]|nr:ABC transporter substrate-binding protein [Candidatus Woesebacteria bacterium]
MVNPRYLLRLLSAFFIRFKALIFLSIGFGVAIFFIIRFIMPFLASPNVQKIGISGRFTPSTLPSSILTKIGNGLTKLDATGNVEPDVASSWETPDQGKTWIFTLKDGINWQDGKKVTSTSINYQFSDVTVERPDAKTIVFKLQNPYSAFPTVVSRPTFKSGLLGTGEWEVKRITLSGIYVDGLTIENRVGQKIIYKFYPTDERAVLGFELGEIDTLSDILNPTPLDTWNKVELTKNINTGEYVAIFFNTQDKLLSDKNLRQALSYGLNRDALGE